MFIKDFEPYFSWDGISDAVEGLAIGWLGDQFDFPSRKPENNYLIRLAALCRSPVNIERGFYQCQLCGLNPMDDDNQFFLEYGTRLGNGEIIVENAGKLYVAPTLIYHYVRDHHYLAPEPFVKGVLQTR